MLPDNFPAQALFTGLALDTILAFLAFSALVVDQLLFDSLARICMTFSLPHLHCVLMSGHFSFVTSLPCIPLICLLNAK